MAIQTRPAYIKVAGQQKQVKNAYVKVSGSWKEIPEAYTKVSGTWKILWAPITVNESFTQCIDHFCTLYYNGAGKIYVQSREPGMNIHTGRGDCGGAQQGNILRYSFDTSKTYNMDITVTMSGPGGPGGRSAVSSLRINQSVNTVYGPVKFATIDSAGGAAIYNYTMTGTII